MLEFEQIRRDIDSLPVEAQSLLVDFIQLLKKRYPLDLQEEKESKNKAVKKDTNTLSVPLGSNVADTKKEQKNK